MGEKKIKSFKEFWPYYVGEHRSPLCRALHYAGTSTALALAGMGLMTFNPFMIAVAPVFGYGPAWIAHFFIEKNRPATFDYPLWSFLADFKMLGLALRGKMGDEVARFYGSTHPAPDAPLIVPA